MLLLSQEPDFHVIGEAQDGEEAVIMATGTRPDMIIMEADLPGLSGPKAAGLIRERLPQTKVLMLSMQKNEKLIRESFASGAIGYALKDADHKEFLGIVRNLIRGEAMISPFLIVPDVKTSSLPALTSRECDIFKFLSKGMSYKEIASELSLSPETVKSHLRRIYVKLQVHNRSEAISIFFDLQQNNG
jgi:DNA-binding NarL/FixJ family response regulator